MTLSIYCIRTQIFGYIDAFEVASIVDAARLKCFIRPVERAKFLHPMRAIFTDCEIQDIKEQLNSVKDHKIVVWGDIDLILRGIHFPSTHRRGTAIDVSILEVSTDRDWSKRAYNRDLLLQAQGVSWETRYKRYRDRRPSIILSGKWSYVPDQIVSGPGSNAFRTLQDIYRVSDDVLRANHRSRTLRNGIQLSWHSTEATSRFYFIPEYLQYSSIGGYAAASPDEQPDDNLVEYGFDSNQAPSKQHLFVMITDDMKELSLDVVQLGDTEIAETGVRLGIPRLLLAHDKYDFSVSLPCKKETPDQKNARLARYTTWITQYRKDLRRGLAINPHAVAHAQAARSNRYAAFIDEMEIALERQHAFNRAELLEALAATAICIGVCFLSGGLCRTYCSYTATLSTFVGPGVSEIVKWGFKFCDLVYSSYAFYRMSKIFYEYMFGSWLDTLEEDMTLALELPGLIPGGFMEGARRMLTWSLQVLRRRRM
jgi:hypothetical protein